MAANVADQPHHRAPRPATDWTAHQLHAYNISLAPCTPATFFGTPIPDLPPPALDPALLADTHAPHTRRFFRHLADADTFPVDFVAHLLELLAFDEPAGAVHTRTELRFEMGGAHIAAAPDLVVFDGEDVVLVSVVQAPSDLTDPAPQLIAAALAAFAFNARRRPCSPAYQLVAGLVWRGTAPTLFAIPVSAALVGAVAAGLYPPAETVVRRLDVGAGMRDVEGRRVALRWLEAFRGVMREGAMALA